MMKHKKHFISLALLLIVMMFFFTGCGKKKLSENDALTRKRVRSTIWPFIYDFMIDDYQFPESYEEMVRAGMQKPINPYTGEPMIDTGSEEWDPEISPGNFHYVPIRDDKGQIGNYVIYVFGEEGLICQLSPAFFAAK